MRAVRIAVPEVPDARDEADADAELLLQLTAQARLPALARLPLASGEFPIAAEGVAVPALADEVPARALNDAGGDLNDLKARASHW